MKKIALSFLCVSIFAGIVCAAATDELSSVMPLLRAPVRSSGQTQQVLQLFLSAKQPDLIFATGASLVRIPPEKIQEGKLLNVFLKNNNPLKQVFAAVILTSMGLEHAEFSELLQEATASADPAVRAYAASAYTILNPSQTQYNNEIIQLYIYDPSLALRAMNLISSSDKQTLQYLKKAAQSDQPALRGAAAAWLGDLQDKAAATQLLKMAQSETDTQAASSVATALAKNQAKTLDKTVKGLKTDYHKQPATTYALALGFMTGNAIEPIKQALSDKNINKRINAARAAAYMANVLASDQFYLYTSDKNFDVLLLKGVIPALSALEKSQNADEQLYAQNALTQIAKLK